MAINWDEASPQTIILEDLEKAEEDDFPQSYSGQAWRACWLMYHKGYKVDADEFLKQDGWGNFPYLMDKDMGLTGFMVGWACNILRYLLGEGPVADGATIIVGRQETPKGVGLRSAKDSAGLAIGGGKLDDEEVRFINEVNE